MPESKIHHHRGRWLVRLGVAGAVVFLALQFIRPALPAAGASAELQAPEPVKNILKNSCYDCHSNKTRLLWFDQIAPAYWLVVHDVREGRKHLNFSEIAKRPAAQQQAMLWEALNQIQLGAMPPAPYARLHPQARLTPADLQVLRDYLASSVKPVTPEATAAAATAQAVEWARHGNAPTPAPALNGIPFPTGYQNWRTISTTERFDNQTLRAILGNDVAVQAIAQNKINPWPDGSILAKVAWQQKPDGQGHIGTGAFLQVEFMIRDQKKYASTMGWGWARWRGLDLKPYGTDASFVNECVSCHAPVKDNDAVFTTPIGSHS